MVTIQKIQQTILLADSYYQELLDKRIEQIENGCTSCDSCLIKNIYMLTEQLTKLVSVELLDENTVKLFECLKMAIINYSGASLSIDPNAQIPGITIDVTIVEGNTLPDWRDVYWEEMTNDVSGYKDTYFNAGWVGLNPDITVQGTVMYRVGIDYINDGQGTIVFNSGKGLYDGQFFRAGNYQEYTPVT